MMQKMKKALKNAKCVCNMIKLLKALEIKKKSENKSKNKLSIFNTDLSS